MTHGKSSRTPDLDELRSRFEQWRQTRRGRARIPDELWSAAAALARRDGVNKTAAALRLDGGKLKRQMTAVVSSRRHAAPPAFVEFVASGADGAAEYTVELEGHHGKLRIHSKGATAADLAELSRALWGLAG
jgi:hypothetical protein